MSSTPHSSQPNSLSTNSDSDTDRVFNHRPAETLLLDRESDVEPELTVVMPTLNEEEGIETCMNWIKAAVEELQLPTEIIISDSSTDRTPEIARELGAIVVEPDETGYGAAYRHAFDRARGQYIAMGDADTTYDFRALPQLLAELEATGADMVLGSRLAGEIKPGAMPALHQYIGNPLLTKFLNVFYGAGVSDAHSGFRVFRKRALDEMNLETTGMEFASEMIMEAGAKGLVIEETPIVYHEREGEETLESFHDGWRHVQFMLVNAPGYLFSVPGVVMSVVGMAVMALAYSEFTIAGVNLGIHSMIAGSLLTIVGYQVASLGVFAAVTSNPIRKPSDPITERVTQSLSLEYGAAVGLILFASGGSHAGVLVYQWLSSGFGAATFTMQALFALTLVVIGLQTVFSAFFLSAINQ